MREFFSTNSCWIEMSWRKGSVGIYRAADSGGRAYFKDKETMPNSTADRVVRAEQVTIRPGPFFVYLDSREQWKSAWLWTSIIQRSLRRRTSAYLFSRHSGFLVQPPASLWLCKAASRRNTLLHLSSVTLLENKVLRCQLHHFRILISTRSGGFI